jgi:leucyl aminopeptidase
MKIAFANPGLPANGVLVVGLSDGAKLGSSAQALDRKMRGGLQRAIKASRFKGKKGQSLTLLVPGGTKLDRVLVVGMGKPEEITDLSMQSVGDQIYKSLAGDAKAVTVAVDAWPKSKLDPATIAAEIGFGAQLRSYRFDKYRTKEKKEDKPVLGSLKICCAGSNAARKIFAEREKIVEGVFFTRDLVSEPANIIYPETLANEAKKLTQVGVKVEVLGLKELQKLGMGMLIGVAQGSVREPRVVVMQWNGGPKGQQPIAFLGKGVTFDTGGISIKPAGGMEDMKWDMGGAGVVIGLMRVLASRKAKANIIGVVGLVENMPSGTAQRPGDIVTSMSGQTVEVINTDAEGRLVLGDCLWYTKERFKPQFMVNLATLTGAIIVALGHEYAGLFSNNDELSERLTKSGKAVNELLWRMPMGDAYDKMIRSPAADMKNIGGRDAGSITAAQFLHRFVDKVPWAHLDIAGVTWTNADRPTVPKGGTGFGVRLLDRFVADHYEAK